MHYSLWSTWPVEPAEFTHHLAGPSGFRVHQRVVNTDVHDDFLRDAALTYRLQHDEAFRLLCEAVMYWDQQNPAAMQKPDWVARALKVIDAERCTAVHLVRDDESFER